LLGEAGDTRTGLPEYFPPCQAEQTRKQGFYRAEGPGFLSAGRPGQIGDENPGGNAGADPEAGIPAHGILKTLPEIDHIADSVQVIGQTVSRPRQLSR
jgi:hypothetical protein